MYFVYRMFQVWLFCNTEICGITKTKIQTSKCLQISRFRSHPPNRKLRSWCLEGCLHFAVSCFASILFLLIPVILNARKKP